MPIGRRQLLVLIAGSPLVACGSARTDARPELRESPPEPTPQPEPEPKQPPATTLDVHVAGLQAKFAGRGWTILAEPPFAVVGDGTRLDVQGHAAAIVRWSVRHLEAAYFEQPPAEIVTIYLFETAESYERHTKELCDDPPDTPYGFYSPSDHALVMNIGTGGGTLVHEIVHPYVETNFPECPTWFNEGLASLYEQSAERDGEIVGLTNWRLAGLQTALREGTVPSFRELCETGEGFYTADPGSNYAQARYLCYWLQEQGLLRRYYTDFRTNCRDDPTGYATLVAIVGPDMAAFRKGWEQFVLALRFP
jgi:hypothetical protein